MYDASFNVNLLINSGTKNNFKKSLGEVINDFKYQVFKIMGQNYPFFHLLDKIVLGINNKVAQVHIR